MKKVEYPTMTISSNVPAKLITVYGDEYDVEIKEITSEYVKYDYGRDNYLDDISKKIINGAEVEILTFVCEKRIHKLI